MQRRGRRRAAPPQIRQGTAHEASPPAFAVGSFVARIPPITLAPGEERLVCYLIPLEIPGPSRLVGGGRLTVGPGLHHGNVTTRPKTGEGIRACPKDVAEGGVGEVLDVVEEGGTVLFGSSTQMRGTEWMRFPDGMAFRVREGFDLVARMHYLNATSEPITVEPAYEWITIDEAKLTTELAPFAWANLAVRIPPRSEHTSTARCIVDRPMHVVSLLPHMHAMGRRMTARFVRGPADGQLFLDSPGYDPDTGVLLRYEPAIDVSQGAAPDEEPIVELSCAWRNTLDKELVWGIGDNEMCILFGYAYPPENVFTALANDDSCAKTRPFEIAP